MAGLDSNTKLLLHCNGADESTTFTDSSPSEHIITAIGTAQLDTSDKKWGTASGLFDGNSDYLTIPDSPDWDIWASLLDSWTIDLWFKNYTDDEPVDTHLIGQYINNNNYWAFRYNGGLNGLQCIGNDGATTINIYGNGQITDGDWHHVAVIKVNADLAIYLDGVRTSNGSFSNVATHNSILAIGARGIGDRFTNGHLDEIRIQKSNPFGADPTSSASITVPTSEYSEAGLLISRNQAIIIQ